MSDLKFTAELLNEMNGSLQHPSDVIKWLLVDDEQSTTTSNRLYYVVQLLLLLLIFQEEQILLLHPTYYPAYCN